MKALRSKIINKYTILFLVIDIYAIYILSNIEGSLIEGGLCFLVVNIFMYLMLIPSMHSFKYDHEKLIVFNVLNPFKEKSIKFTEIENIELRSKAFLGTHILIRLKYEKNNFGLAGTSEKELEEMISFIQDQTLNLRKTD